MKELRGSLYSFSKSTCYALNISIKCSSIMEFLGQFLSTSIMLLIFHTACLNHCFFFFLTILTKFPVSLVSLGQHLLQHPIACFYLFSLKVSYLVPNKLVHNTCLTLMSRIDINLYVCIHTQDKYCLLILVPIMLSFCNGSNFGENVYFKLHAHPSMCATDFFQSIKIFPGIYSVYL